MNNVYLKEFQLPYEKREVLVWIQRHSEHNIHELTEQDEQWKKSLLLGEPARLVDLVELNLTPSVWFDAILNKTSFTENQVYNWIDEHYDMLVFEKWTKWIAKATRAFVDETIDEWPQELIEWSSKLAEHYSARDSETWGGDIPSILVKGTPTRKVTFGLKDPDTSRLPNLYSPTKKVDQNFISELQTEAYCV